MVARLTQTARTRRGGSQTTGPRAELLLSANPDFRGENWLAFHADLNGGTHETDTDFDSHEQLGGNANWFLGLTGAAYSAASLIATSRIRTWLV